MQVIIQQLADLTARREPAMLSDDNGLGVSIIHLSEESSENCRWRENLENQEQRTKESPNQNWHSLEPR